MFNNDNQVAVVLNYSDLCEICDFYDVSPGEISDNPCYARYIADHHSDLQNLISGYVEWVKSTGISVMISVMRVRQEFDDSCMI